MRDHAITPPRRRRSSPLLRLAVVAAALAGAVAASSASAARADVQLGADLDSAIPISSPADPGGGFAARFGFQLHVPLLVITPEAAFNYEGFTDTYGPAVYRLIGGLRLGLGEVLRFGVYAHGGLGHLSADVPGPNPTRTGFTYDLGVFIDFTLLPLLNLGVHAAYAKIPGDEDPNFQWIVLGAHAELIF